MDWPGQSCECEEAEAQLERSTQPDRRRVRESSSFFPNKRLGTTVLGTECWTLGQMIQCADSRQRKMRDKTPGSAPRLPVHPFPLEKILTERRGSYTDQECRGKGLHGAPGVLQHLQQGALGGHLV